MIVFEDFVKIKVSDNLYKFNYFSDVNTTESSLLLFTRCEVFKDNKEVMTTLFRYVNVLCIETLF